MATLNIKRDVNDEFYRYKMPKLISKVEGKGNGIKTVIPNMTDIARSLSRPPSYPTKYFGCELGAQVKCDDKNERYIVNGEHEADKLQNLLDGFIKSYVLCPSCENPETDIVINDGDITMACKACGKTSPGEMRHKLATFVLKNPPEVAAKNQRRQRKAATAQVNEIGEAVSQDSSAFGAKAPTESSLVGWSDATDAVTDRLEATTLDGVAVYDKFGDWLLSEREEELTDEAIINEATELGILHELSSLLASPDHKSPCVLVQCIFDGKQNIPPQITKRKDLLIRFGQDNKKCQKAIIGGLERIIYSTKGDDDKWLKSVPAVLLALYNEDIIPEATFMDWARKPSKKYVSSDVSKKIIQAAEPFLTWLAEANESDSEEEEDD